MSSETPTIQQLIPSIIGGFVLGAAPLIVGVVWVMQTFPTHEDLHGLEIDVAQMIDAHQTRDHANLQTLYDDLAGDLKSHIDAVTIERLLARVEDVGDQKWLLQQRMNEPGGDTRENRERRRELEKREQKLRDQIECLRNERNHCLELSRS